ncbi:sigma-70 family RNA polymerase sigma factor [Nonomuraea sp. NPDC026600]|uniref:RNA polymerase sigma factor n=1 Tax=Nonomuraea sp. NPDC026600 TaxID=3155363 RepID=UPI0033DFCADD
MHDPRQEDVPAEDDLEAFFQEWFDPLTRRALFYSRGNSVIAEEAVDHAVDQCVKHHSATGQLAPEDRVPAAWMTTIIRRKAYSLLRREDAKWRAFRKLFKSPRDEIEHVHDRMIAAQAHRFLSSLGGGDRMIAIMHYSEEMTAADIAVELGLNASTVRTRLQRIRGRLREQLGISVRPSLMLERGATE